MAGTKRGEIARKTEAGNFYLGASLKKREHRILPILKLAAMTIYLVEDDVIYLDFLKKSLGRNANYQISTFTSAEEALKQLDAGLPDVLVIDYKLPGKSGIELYEHIKSKITDSNKVILLSAIDDGNMVLSFIQKGVRDYVIKDETVIDSLVAILEGKEDDYYLFS